MAAAVEKKIKFSMGVPWSDLPGDLLERIANILLAVDIRNPIGRNPIHYIRFRAVCVQWRSSTLHPCNLKPPLPDKLPWALHSLDSRRRDAVTCLRLSDSKTFEMSVPEELRGDDTDIVGSTDGWLALLTYRAAPAAFRLVLVNPLTRAQIHLPPLASVVESDEDGSITTDCFGHLSNRGLVWMRHRLFFRGKVLLSEDHTVVMVYLWFVRVLVFARPGRDEQWTTINLPPDWNYLSDILHHKGTFYVVNHKGRLAICNLVPPASLTQVASAQVEDTKFQFWFLASSGEELLLIVRSGGLFPQGPKVRVFRLEDPSSSILEEVKSLGDRILFLGWNRSLCLSASDCPPGYNRPNTICFTITSSGSSGSDGAKYYQFGFHNLEDGSFYPKHPGHEFARLMWFTPSLR